MILSINLPAVFVAAVTGMVVGALWYSPWLFAKPWLRAVGKSDADIKKANMLGAYLMSFLALLLCAYVLAHIIAYTGALDAVDGVQAGVWAWLGFVLTTTGTNALFEGRPKNLFLINVAHHLVVFLAMGAILGAWQ